MIENLLGFTGNQSFGYIMAGNTSSPLTLIERIDYSNDSGSSSPKGNLETAQVYCSATGNADFGYLGGKYPAGVLIQRIDYSNDTATASPKGGLNTARYGLAATGNTSFGYFGGGSSPDKSTVDRVDYSNDTATAVEKGPLSLARYYLGAVSSRANATPLKGPGVLEVSVAFGILVLLVLFLPEPTLDTLVVVGVQCQM